MGLAVKVLIFNDTKGFMGIERIKQASMVAIGNIPIRNVIKAKVIGFLFVFNKKVGINC